MGFLEFALFKEHISSELGGVPMPLTGAIPEGPSFFCPHCGALYAVTYSRPSTSDSNVARCVVCGQIMDKWDSTRCLPSGSFIDLTITSGRGLLSSLHSRIARGGNIPAEQI
jgi:hypothetical protein